MSLSRSSIPRFSMMIQKQMNRLILAVPSRADPPFQYRQNIISAVQCKEVAVSNTDLEHSMAWPAAHFEHMDSEDKANTQFTSVLHLRKSAPHIYVKIPVLPLGACA